MSTEANQILSLKTGTNTSTKIEAKIKENPTMWRHVQPQKSTEQREALTQ